jgi:glycosyltransferase involved in cell wall biosynthesis
MMARGSRSESRTLLLFTGSYPYAAALEDTFVAPELPFLTEHFDRVVLIPTRRGGGRADPGPTVVVEEGLASLVGSLAGRARGLGMALVSRLFWVEFIAQPVDLLRFGGVGRLLRTVVRAELTYRWVRGYLRHRSELGQIVAYTYWCDATTTGIAMAKRDQPDVALVSRAHGADVYAERYRPAYFPGRTFTLERLDGLFPDSAQGLRYLLGRYPWMTDRSEVARMGVADPGFAAPASTGSTRVIVSCSRIVPIKRVDLIGRAAAEAARLRPDLRIEWHHFGEGDDRDRIETEARAAMPSNAIAHFHGFESVQALMRFYETHPVDVFVNASTSEGTPVAIMEAASCGIPIVATAVGGNTEIVSQDNGETVAADASAIEIAEAVLRVTSQNRNARLRAASHQIWRERYDAATNYATFARRIDTLPASTAKS